MRWYVSDYNGILTDLKARLGDKLTNPRDANVWVTWQDCVGSYKDLIEASKKYYPKPVYCVQHGRAATRDYGTPNKYPLNADRFLCWGSDDYNRMCGLGYESRVSIVGCPLNVQIKPRVPHKEKVVLFVPVNTGKEEPENIATYYELLKIKYSKASIKVVTQGLKDVKSFNQLCSDFDVVTKLLPWHERQLYHGNLTMGYQDSAKNNALIFSLLQNVDAVVGLDESTTEAFAMAHDVPVIIVDGFQYKQRGVLVPPYQTKGALHTPLCDLAKAIDFTLAHPNHLREERKAVAESEMGISYGDATENIIKAIKNDARNTGIFGKSL